MEEDALATAKRVLYNDAFTRADGLAESLARCTAARKQIADDKEQRLKERLELDQHGATHKKLKGSVLGFGPDSAARLRLSALVESMAFQNLAFTAVMLSCLCLAFDFDEGSEEHEVLSLIDLCLCVLFTVEMLLKIFINGPCAYLRNSWDSMDGFIVVVGWCAIVLPHVAIFEAMRGVRAFRLVLRVPAVKVVVMALISAMPAVGSSLLLLALLLLIFAVLGVSLFKGVLFHCVLKTTATAAAAAAAAAASNTTAAAIALTLDKGECLAANHTMWVHAAPQHFDDIGNSIFTLLRVSSLAGWGDVMVATVNAADEMDRAPVVGNRPLAALYFVAAIASLRFLCANLVASVLISRFRALKAEFNGSALLTHQQVQSQNSQRLLDFVRLAPSLKAPQNPLGQRLFAVAQHPHLDNVITLHIVANAVTMSMKRWDASPEDNATLETINMYFLVVFTGEAVIKLLGLGPRGYWQNTWNRFDFFIVIAGLAGVVFDLGSQSSVLRTLRVARLFRLLKLRSLHTLFRALLASLPALRNVGALLAILLFAFAVPGNRFFRDVPRTPDGLTDDVNFDSVFSSMLALFQVPYPPSPRAPHCTARCGCDVAAMRLRCVLRAVRCDGGGTRGCSALQGAAHA